MIKAKAEQADLIRSEKGKDSEDYDLDGLTENPDMQFRVSVGYATAAAEEISGDSVISCGLPDGSLALILSDGMGKGIRAAADSRLVVRRLRKNLKSGMLPANAIKEVNHYMIERREEAERAFSRDYAISDETQFRKKDLLGIFSRTEKASEKDLERFATIDLLIVNRSLSKAKFYKMGAASSFLVRTGTVKSFEKAALPIGMIDEIKLKQLTAELRDGDVIVMVSDGITEADRSDLFGNWLPEFLHDISESEIMPSTRKLAKYILNEAIKHYEEREQDDLTVAVIKITADT